MNDERPTLRIVHHLARTGGTLISRCLASMRGVTMLSEIHPRGSEVALQFDPLFQGQYWFKLLSGAETDALRAERADFASQIDALRERAAERDETLVLRDWSHPDFMCLEALGRPAGRSATAEALAERFRLVRVATVRHPLAQWQSWQRYAPESGISVGDFMAGCRRFAESARDIGFVRYEDFLADSGPALKRLSDRLEISFDDQYAYRWIFYRTVSGDVRGLDAMEIRAATSPPVDDPQLGPIEANSDYQRTLDLLGYDSAIPARDVPADLPDVATA